MTCFITGCYLFEEEARKLVRGDLHRIGGAWVFNAVMEDGETNWLYVPSSYSVPQDLKIAIIRASATYFERRGVIVISHSDVHLTEAAEAYISP